MCSSTDSLGWSYLVGKIFEGGIIERKGEKAARIEFRVLWLGEAGRRGGTRRSLRSGSGIYERVMF